MGGGKTASGQSAVRGAIAPANGEEQKATDVRYGCFDRKEDTVVFDLKTSCPVGTEPSGWGDQRRSYCFCKNGECPICCVTIPLPFSLVAGCLGEMYLHRV